MLHILCAKFKWLGRFLIGFFVIRPCKLAAYVKWMFIATISTLFTQEEVWIHIQRIERLQGTVHLAINITQ